MAILDNNIFAGYVYPSAVVIPAGFDGNTIVARIEITALD